MKKRVTRHVINVTGDKHFFSPRLPSAIQHLRRHEPVFSGTTPCLFLRIFPWLATLTGSAAYCRFHSIPSG